MQLLPMTGRPGALLALGFLSGVVCAANLSYAAAPDFEPVVFYAAGSGPQAVAVADLNGDTVPDLAVANQTSDDVSILLGNGDGTFQSATSFAANGDGRPISVAVADFDEDGARDLVIANRSGDFDIGDVSVLLGNGDGTFQPAVIHGLGVVAQHSGPYAVTVADVNGDNHIDIVTGNGGQTGAGTGTPTTETVSVLLGNGDGTFQGATAIPGGNFSVVSVVVADVDADTVPDIIAANGQAETVSVLRGNGNGTFQAPVSFVTPEENTDVAVADLNDDDVLDFATGGARDSLVSVLLGNGDGTFQPAIQHAMEEWPNSLAAEDLNEDGIPDLVTANPNSNDVDVLIGEGNGTFPAIVDFFAGSLPVFVTSADVNADSVPDLVTVNFNGNNVGVLLNTAEPAGGIVVPVLGPGGLLVLVGGLLTVAFLGHARRLSRE